MGQERPFGALWPMTDGERRFWDCNGGGQCVHYSRFIALCGRDGRPQCGLLLGEGLMDSARRVFRLLRGRSGQVLAEYGVLLWFFTLVGVASLVMFFFAFEEGVIGYYADVVDVICLPIP